MRSLTSQCQNSALCCFGENSSRPFVKGEDKVWVVILRNAWLVPLLRGKTKFGSNLKLHSTSFIKVRGYNMIIHIILSVAFDMIIHKKTHCRPIKKGAASKSGNK